MNRREALEWVAVLMGGTISIPTMATSWQSKQASESLFSPSQIALIAELAETIMPETPDAPGAKTAGIAPLIALILTDCYTKADQELFVAGLANVQNLSQQIAGKTFENANASQQETVLKQIEQEALNARNSGVKNHEFWFILKENVLFSYFTSEIGATKGLRYDWVPGKYESISYKKGDKAWAT